MQILVLRAQLFFPAINLTGTGGFQSQSFSNLFSKPSLFWSLGPFSLLTLSQPLVQQVIFDGGRLRGLLNQAKAQYFETVAQYRQTVLTAFQDVEDSLIAIHQLDKEIHTQTAATYAAKRAWNQRIYRYKGGLVTFLQVVVVENIALQSELSLVNVSTRRQVASVQLIKALGGGWSLDMGQRRTTSAHTKKLTPIKIRTEVDCVNASFFISLQVKSQPLSVQSMASIRMRFRERKERRPLRKRGSK